MLLRFVVKNFLSFNEETEFNLFPSSRTQNLSHHKANANGVDILRMSALYGANGSGKSNLIKAITALRVMIVSGDVSDFETKKFKLNPANSSEPTEFAIEFSCQNKNYYYTISVNNKQVVYEYLAESIKSKDIMIFERKIQEDKQTINFYNAFIKDEKNKYLTEALADKFLEKNQLLISLLATKYQEEFEEIDRLYKFFKQDLIIITPETIPAGLEHMLDSSNSLKLFYNSILKTLSTGVNEIVVQKREVDNQFEASLKKHRSDVFEHLKSDIGAAINFPFDNENILLMNIDDKIIAKVISTIHKDTFGKDVMFSLNEESDGTKRLIELILAFENLINNDIVFIIDEIERSIHPLMIKELITKFSKDTKAKGQLIFSTHESCLLDQDIIRTDEVWFAQKDGDGSSKLYSLSDYKVHNTLNIENNYLSGRYGAIPFLSNLKDLNWHKQENVEA